MAASDSNLTLTRLREVLDYCPDTGRFTWKVRTAQRTAVGKTAGSVNKVSGYVFLSIDGHAYLGHRVAWFYTYGAWPPKIDHRNLKRADNRIDNLRVATQSQNMANQPCKSPYGHKGVYHQAGRFFSQIRIDGKTKYLGRFDTPGEAAQAYEQAARVVYGEFARPS